MNSTSQHLKFSIYEQVNDESYDSRIPSKRRTTQISSQGDRLRELRSYWVKILPHKHATSNCGDLPQVLMTVLFM